MQQASNIEFFDWITLAAIILGPIFAVLVTRLIDSSREQRAKKLEVFKILMRTRGSRLNPDHVGALNLIEVEYYKEKNVLTALETYFRHLNDRGIDSTDWAQRTDHLFTRLVSQMAKSLGYEIEQLQILSGGYTPSGWHESENRQAEISRMFLSLLKGETALPVRNGATVQTQHHTSNFPPPPV